MYVNKNILEGGLRIEGIHKESTGENPLVSVITVVFNGSEKIQHTINSVASQTYESIEFIVYDGGSTDNTVDILVQYSHQIDYWKSEKDFGIYHAMNKGVSKANGNWIIFLGSDDYLADEYAIENMVRISAPEIACIYGDVIYDNGYRFCSRLNSLMLISNNIHHQSALYNKKLFNTFKYDESCKVYSDYELNLIIYKNGCQTSKLNRTISRCGRGGISDTNKELAKSEIKYLRRKHFNIIHSIFLDILMEILLSIARVKRVITTHT